MVPSSASLPTSKAFFDVLPGLVVGNDSNVCGVFRQVPAPAKKRLDVTQPSVLILPL